MRELHSDEIGERRVALVETETKRYRVTIAVRGPDGSWEDISLHSDQNLTLPSASRCYQLRHSEQLARALDAHDWTSSGLTRTRPALAPFSRLSPARPITS
jgi:hypothetical protein